MKTAGLTGGIGSGKSTVASIFRALGVPVFSSDEIARDLQEHDAEVVRGIKKLFGETIYGAEGKLDRVKVAAAVFSDKEKLAKLNAIVHPAVGKAFEQFLRDHAKSPYVIKEAAILFENDLDKQLDAMITVVAPEQIRLQRVMDRDRISEEAVRARMKNQLSDEEKIERSDFVVRNDGKEMVLPQVIKIHEALTA